MMNDDLRVVIPQRNVDPQPLLLARLARGTMGSTPAHAPPELVWLAIGDEQLRSETCELMRRENLDVHCAEKGAALLQYMGDAMLQEPSCQVPRLIIADATLKGCLGGQLLAALKTLEWGTSLILLQDRIATAYREVTAPLTLGAVDAHYLCEFSLRLIDSLERTHACTARAPQRRWFSLSEALRTISMYSDDASNKASARAQ